MLSWPCRKMLLIKLTRYELTFTGNVNWHPWLNLEAKQWFSSYELSRDSPVLACSMMLIWWCGDKVVVSIGVETTVMFLLCDVVEEVQSVLIPITSRNYCCALVMTAHFDVNHCVMLIYKHICCQQKRLYFKNGSIFFFLLFYSLLLPLLCH